MHVRVRVGQTLPGAPLSNEVGRGRISSVDRLTDASLGGPAAVEAFASESHVHWPGSTRYRASVTGSSHSTFSSVQQPVLGILNRRCALILGQVVDMEVSITQSIRHGHITHG